MSGWQYDSDLAFGCGNPAYKELGPVRGEVGWDPMLQVYGDNGDEGYVYVNPGWLNQKEADELNSDKTSVLIDLEDQYVSATKTPQSQTSVIAVVLKENLNEYCGLFI
jgi:hypothetical protein